MFGVRLTRCRATRAPPPEPPPPRPGPSLPRLELAMPLGARHRHRLPGGAAVHVHRLRDERVRAVALVRDLPPRLRAAGAAGEALRTVLGRHPTIAEVDLVQNVVALTTIAAMVALVVALCRRRTTIAYAGAAASTVAPFAFDSVGGQRRPDLLAFLLLAVVGLCAGVRAVAPTRLAAVGRRTAGVVHARERGRPADRGPVARARAARRGPRPPRTRARPLSRPQSASAPRCSCSAHSRCTVRRARPRLHCSSSTHRRSSRATVRCSCTSATPSPRACSG